MSFADEMTILAKGAKRVTEIAKTMFSDEWLGPIDVGPNESQKASNLMWSTRSQSLLIRTGSIGGRSRTMKEYLSDLEAVETLVHEWKKDIDYFSSQDREWALSHLSSL